MPGAGGALGRGQDDARCGSPPACCAPIAAGCAAGTRTWLDTDGGHRRPARAPRGGLRVPGLRAVPQPQRVAQRGLRDATASAGRAARAARVELLDRFGHGRPRRCPPAPRSPAASASGWRWPGRSRASPAVLLLDEPLSALDARTRGRAGRELGALLAAAERAGAAGDPRLRGGGAARRPGGDRGRRAGGAVGHRGTSWRRRRARAFVAELTGAVVLNGTARGRRAA